MNAIISSAVTNLNYNDSAHSEQIRPTTWGLLQADLFLHCPPNYQYISFDDIKNIDYFESDPKGFLKNYHNQIIFDEIQFVPRLFHYIKMAIDQDRQHYGKFVLTGSSQFSYLRNIAESLAGRIDLMSLLPFELQEMPKALLQDSIYQGASVLSNGH